MRFFAMLANLLGDIAFDIHHHGGNVVATAVHIGTLDKLVGTTLRVTKPSKNFS